MIEIVGAKEKNVDPLAGGMGWINGQKSVLVTSLAGSAKKIARNPALLSHLFCTRLCYGCVTDSIRASVWRQDEPNGTLGVGTTRYADQ